MSTIHMQKRGESRFYTRDGTAYPGVTSVLNMYPKPFLSRWSAGMAADLAVRALDFVRRMADEDEKGAIAYLAGASKRYARMRAAVGTKAHDLFERIIRGEHIGAVHPDMEPYRDNFELFLAAVNPELLYAENIVWSDAHEYAGSFDAIIIVWFDEAGNITPDRSGTPRTLIVDWKTGKRIYPEVALQLAAYGAAPFFVDADGTVHTMRMLDGGAVLHITDTDASFHLVDIGPDVFAQFLRLRGTFKWDTGASKNVIGSAIWSTARGMVTGTQRRGK